jgi:hypothetical protein
MTKEKSQANFFEHQICSSQLSISPVDARIPSLREEMKDTLKIELSMKTIPILPSLNVDIRRREQ